MTPLRSRADSAQKDIPQNDRIVVCFVMGREDERYSAQPGVAAQFVKLFRVPADLIRVSLSKFLPAGGIMPEPLAQGGAGGDVFHPLIDSGVRLAKASGP